MIVKPYASFTHTIEDRTYTLLVPQMTDYGEAYDVTWKFLKQILEMANQSLDAQQRQQSPSVEPEVQQPQ